MNDAQMKVSKLLLTPLQFDDLESEFKLLDTKTRMAIQDLYKSKTRVSELRSKASLQGN